MPLAPGSANSAPSGPRPDRQKLKQIVGLAWDSDSSVLFLEDGIEYSVPTDTPDPPLKVPLDLHGLALATAPDISATRSPALTESGSFAYCVQTPTGPQVLVQNAGKVTPGPAAAVFALSPAGDRIAFVPPGGGAVIRTLQSRRGQERPGHSRPLGLVRVRSAADYVSALVPRRHADRLHRQQAAGPRRRDCSPSPSPRAKPSSSPTEPAGPRGTGGTSTLPRINLFNETGVS